MPSIKDFDRKKKKSRKKTDSQTVTKKKQEPDDDLAIQTGYDINLETKAESSPLETKVQQRRPSKMPDTDKPINEMNASGVEPLEPGPESFQSFSEPDSFELRFPGSFLLKAKVPMAFNLAERIAGEWVNDGKFEALPVGHPLAQILAAKALVKAKSLEKNVLNSTSVTLVKLGLEYAKSKIKR